MFKSGNKLLEYCSSNKLSIWEAVLAKEIENYGTSKEEIFEKNMEIIKVMENSSKQALYESEKSLSGMIGGERQINFLNILKKIILYYQKRFYLLWP